MPQMAPMWWSLLFLMFITIYGLMMIMMYTIKSYKLKYISNSLETKEKMNWKW